MVLAFGNAYVLNREMVKLMKEQGLITGAAFLCPLKSCVCWIPTVCALASYVVVLLAVGSPFQEWAFVTACILFSLAACACGGH